MVIGRQINKEKHKITIVRSEAERARNNSPPVCRPLARAMDIQLLRRSRCIQIFL